jgi:hypothetical protein
MKSALTSKKITLFRKKIKKGGGNLKTQAPKSITWLISVIVAALGVLIYFRIISVPVLAPYSFWLVAGAFTLLALGNILKDL